MRSSAKGRETSFCVVEGVASVIANGYLFSYKHTVEEYFKKDQKLNNLLCPRLFC